ncbi:MAG: hypothetical protein PWQ89_1695 [Verrucomicrobiota bacterium]|jgi:hypothetical protein|nr:hypothetical protein [Verrucomicrobiota bacterium]
MLKLNASYSKKVPAGEPYSSRSYLAAIEVELPHGLTGRELQEKIHDTFNLVKASVESEITSQTQDNTPEEPKSSQKPQEVPGKATNKQIQFILRLGKERQKGLPELNEMAAALFRAESIYQLTKKDASALVDQLKLAA